MSDLALQRILNILGTKQDESNRTKKLKNKQTTTTNAEMNMASVMYLRHVFLAQVLRIEQDLHRASVKSLIFAQFKER